MRPNVQNPRKVRLDIIGGGGVALAFIKELLRTEFSAQFSMIRVWQKASRTHHADLGFSSTLFEDTLRLRRQFQRRRGDERVCEPIFRSYAELSELSRIVTESIGWAEEGGKSLLMILSRYNLREIFGERRAWRELTEESRAYVRATLKMPRVDSLTSHGQVGDSATATFEMYRGQFDSINEGLTTLSQRSAIIPVRLWKLRDSALAMHELGQVLAGYAGTVFNFLNEVDTTSNVLRAASGIAAKMIVSPAQHDTIRVEYALQRMLGGSQSEPTVHCEVLGPHNNLAFVLESSLRIDGRPLALLGRKREVLDALERAGSWAALHGERLYRNHGTSNEDSVLALMAATEDFVQPGVSGAHRAICYHETAGVFTGLLGNFDSAGRFVVPARLLDELDPAHRKLLDIAVAEQQRLDEMVSAALRGARDKLQAARPRNDPRSTRDVGMCS